MSERAVLEVASAKRKSENVSPYHPASPSAVYRLTWFMTMLGLLLVVVTSVPYLAEEIQYRLERGKQRAQVEIATTALKDGSLSDLSMAYQLVSQRVGPSVVHINVAEAPTTSGSQDGETEMRRIHPRVNSGQGSGVIIDSDGFIVTNRHVIDGSARIEVALSDGRRRAAKVVGYDELTDIAILKIDAEGLIAAEWGDSDDSEVGALVWALGSPFGLERSVTFGILSAKHRAGLAGTPFQDLMQTDAAVNPGNSGGPLVDARGRVIGINTAIVGTSYQGVSFAIPSRVAQRVYRDLKTQGAVIRGWLGVEPLPVTEELAQQMGLAEPRGALVRKLADDRGGASPARQAGIQPGDVILRWNGVNIDSPRSLIAQVSQTAIDEKVPVLLMREGQELTLDVVVGVRPARID
ncbi:MAG TPA: trypsin-like peptidase domain-containing protein [Pirellulaceae bacterium]|nr:trypsin-like peptidase domain-containing protein [Pirellulaceae bacterium]